MHSCSVSPILSGRSCREAQAPVPHNALQMVGCAPSQQTLRQRGNPKANGTATAMQRSIVLQWRAMKRQSPEFRAFASRDSSTGLRTYSTCLKKKLRDSGGLYCSQKTAKLVCYFGPCWKQGIECLLDALANNREADDLSNAITECRRLRA